MGETEFIKKKQLRCSAGKSLFRWQENSTDEIKVRAILYQRKWKVFGPEVTILRSLFTVLMQVKNSWPGKVL